MPKSTAAAQPQPTPIADEYWRLQRAATQMLDAADRAHAQGDRATDDRCHAAAERLLDQAARL